MELKPRGTGLDWELVGVLMFLVMDGISITGLKELMLYVFLLLIKVELGVAKPMRHMLDL